MLQIHLIRNDMRTQMFDRKRLIRFYLKTYKYVIRRFCHPPEPMT